MKLNYVFLGILLAAILVVSFAGFRGSHSPRPPLELFPDMNYQDKVKDQQPSAFFADGNSARAPIPGTIAQEMPAKVDYWSTGKWDDTHWGAGIPVHEARAGGRALAVDAADMARGRERYNISCAVCHGAAGDGQGITSKYGLNGAASYHVDRLRQEADGQLFNTISNGTGQMLGYGYNITIDDRWRIVMYVRALQRSQNAAYADASAQEQAVLDATRKTPAQPPQPPAPQANLPEIATPPASPSSTEPPQLPSSGPSKVPVNNPKTNTPGFSVPTRPPGGASNERQTAHPIVYLTQQSMKGWYDAYGPF